MTTVSEEKIVETPLFRYFHAMRQKIPRFIFFAFPLCKRCLGLFHLFSRRLYPSLKRSVRTLRALASPRVHSSVIA
ncbi:hypothetical protein WA026_007116 [Henosepilachna vigintioctopunctata]|uniref:Uncharacterized protein n=1 Tax=Henosepilachna vigintioctopunctata TaxID=420089 RepID=A0AAW1V9C8_9CUCU